MQCHLDLPWEEHVSGNYNAFAAQLQPGTSFTFRSHVWTLIFRELSGSDQDNTVRTLKTAAPVIIGFAQTQ